MYRNKVTNVKELQKENTLWRSTSQKGVNPDVVMSVVRYVILPRIGAQGQVNSKNFFPLSLGQTVMCR